MKKSAMFIFSVFLLSFASMLGSANATIYYVATNGSDSNNGSIDYPFKTIEHAGEMVDPGDTVIFRDGIYNDTNGHQSFAINHGGEPGNYVTFKAENKWGAIFDGNNYSIGWGLDLNNQVNYVIIEGFEIRNILHDGVHLNANNSYIIVRQNLIHHIGMLPYPEGGGIAIGIGGYSNNILIDRNVIHTNGKLNPDTDPPGPPCDPWFQCYNQAHGIYIWHGNYVNITNNIFYNHKSGWAVHIWSDEKFWKEHFVIEGNTFADANPHRDGHIIIGPYTNDVTIKGNIFYNPSNAMIRLRDSCSEHVTNVVITNNLGNVGNIISGVACNDTISDNYVNTDPLFVDADARDYHLQASSPAIDNITSSNLTWDFDSFLRPQGARYDIGAYEYTEIPSPMNSSNLSSSSVTFVIIYILVLAAVLLSAVFIVFRKKIFSSASTLSGQPSLP